MNIGYEESFEQILVIYESFEITFPFGQRK